MQVMSIKGFILFNVVFFFPVLWFIFIPSNVNAQVLSVSPATTTSLDNIVITHDSGSSRRYYLWSAFLLLAFVPGLSHAVTYVTPSTQGYYKGLDGAWYRRDGTGPQYTISAGKVHSASKINTGVKLLTMPSTMTIASTAGRGALKLAKFSGPLLLTSALLEYVLDHTNGEIYEDEGAFYKHDDQNTGPNYVCYKRVGTAACQAGVGAAEWSCAVTVCDAAKGAVAQCNPANSPLHCNGPLLTDLRNKNNVYPSYTYTTTTNTCPEGQIYIDGTGCQEYQPPTPSEEDWEGFFSQPFAPLSDVAADDLAATPEGVEVEGPPLVDGLPATVPLSDPYQKPDSTWEQPVADITPGPNGSVGVETYVQPTTGPEGIPDPLIETRPITNTPQSGDGETPIEIDVKLCEEGDTNLACVELGTPEDTEIEKDEFELDFSHSPVAFTSGGCPAGPQFDTPWGSQTFDMYWPCEFATSIKPIILALGAFAAMAIFVGGLRTS